MMQSLPPVATVSGELVIARVPSWKIFAFVAK
jgi:hypothetical protein